MPKIILDAIPTSNATGYPEPFAKKVERRHYRRLGPRAGLTDFAVSQVLLMPGAWSSMRHWHEDEDEFVVVIRGKCTLVDDTGRHLLNTGDCAAFPKNDGNGHCLINEGMADCVFIVVGQAVNGNAHYSDVDMAYDAESKSYTRKDGTPI